MLRVVFFIVLIAAAALGLGWLADRPGSLTLQWLGYTVETSVFVAIVAAALLVLALLWLWSVLAFLISRPAALARWRRRRKQRQGHEALSRGIIAVGAGDRNAAAKNASIARRALPNEPLTALLRAQSAQMNGDRAKARRLFEGMASSPDTELLGLRGLYLEARREDDLDAARQIVERTVRKDPNLGWSIAALFEMQCRAGDWGGALKTLATMRQHGHTEADMARRRRAVLLTAQAIETDETAPDRSLAQAREAHELAPDLVPAAAIAGRLLGAKGETRRATRLIARTWRKNPHPELAAAYAYARPGDAAVDRLRRVRKLVAITPGHPEAAIALAGAAVDAREWNEARAALRPLADDRPAARVCVLMARIEREQHDDKGREREWLARAVRAPRDPVWIADGYISERWLPVSPITGVLDAFEWRAPVEALPYLTPEAGEARSAPPPITPILPPVSEAADMGTKRGTVAERMAEASPPPANAAPAPSEPPEARLIAIAPKPSQASPGASGSASASVDSFPRAPDDPGAGPTDADEVVTPLARYRQPVR